MDIQLIRSTGAKRIRTEQAYVYWVRGFVRWSGMRHPREMGMDEVQGFLSMLANERRVSVSTHRQALSALLFLYMEVLAMDLPWMQELGRPVSSKRIPVVLTQAEVQALLSHMAGVTGLLARLLYGSRGGCSSCTMARAARTGW